MSVHSSIHLNQAFPSRWVGRDGPIAWPPGSPDFTPPPSRLLFMGLCQGQGERDSRSEHQRAAARFTDAVTAIPQATLHAVWREMQDRLDICQATNGAHVEGH
jgi:hypothetical protein